MKELIEELRKLEAEVPGGEWVDLWDQLAAGFDRDPADPELFLRMEDVIDHEWGNASEEVRMFIVTTRNALPRLLRVVEAAQQTLDENRHLADGDDCTLKLLRDALEDSV